MQHTLIKASAGTGKTFTLATRMIRLLLTGDEPSSIVALTFSRAAAGEIFNKFVERLAKAAASDNNAAQESQIIFDGITPELREIILQRHTLPLSRQCFIELLHKVIATQHLSMIGTIDSFMFKMVQSLPLELGLQGAIEIMDAFETKQRIQNSLSAVMHNTQQQSESNTIIESFRAADFKLENRCYFDKMLKLLTDWQSLLFEFPLEEMWGGGNIFNQLNAFRIHGRTEELAEQLRQQIMPHWEQHQKREDNWNTFCDFIRDFNNVFTAEQSTLTKNILNAWNPQTNADSICFNNERKKFTFTNQDAQLISRSIETICALHLQACINTTRSIYRVINKIEAVYNRETRRQGRMTFDDIPKLIATLETPVKSNLEYRFDSQFQHWALDEFQDTSSLQWNAIRNLIDEVIQSGDHQRSVFIVGDVKQAIYGWRGGSVAIFDQQASSRHYHLANLSRSYRYAPQIADFVNIIFNGSSVRNWLSSKADNAAELWSNYWEEHESRQPDGFVEVDYAAEKEESDDTTECYVRSIIALLQKRRPWENGLSTAILVRSNKHGIRFAELLKQAGIPTVWEGESTIETPIVNALLHALKLAEHPGDKLAWRHICCSPLAALLFKDECAAGDEPGAALLSRRILHDIARNGLERTLQNYAVAIDATLDDFNRSHLHALIRAANKFSVYFDAKSSLCDFINFIEQFTSRDISSCSTVRIQTIHRSKGLGFDYVIVPIIESRGITTLSNQSIIRDANANWIIQKPNKIIYENHPLLKQAMEHMVDKSTFEELCVMYVAMTRAKRALSVIIKRPAKNPTDTLYFSDYISACLNNSLPWSVGSIDWQQVQNPIDSPLKTDQSLPHLQRRERKLQSRATPSATVLHGSKASILFSTSDNDALAKGTRTHEALSAITWLEPPFRQPMEIDRNKLDLVSASALRDALIRPDNLVDLWRERSFEIILDGRWTSGTFDRVVFTGTSDNMQALIIDFKTNRQRTNETSERFHERMRSLYQNQMSLYAQALAQLTALTQSNIQTALLLTDTRECLYL